MSALYRRILVNREQLQKFRTNKISTCKYNIFLFLPRFLIGQFRLYSNVFFLVTVLLQQLPDVSPTGRFTTLVPLLIILLISAAKEIFEDLKRRKMDMQVNNYEIDVLRQGAWQCIRWKHLKVGEIVRVHQNQSFPADLVIFSSSEAEGMAYIETSSLDGETNLKNRQALYHTAEYVTISQLYNMNAEIECEPPNVRVNEFTGSLKIGSECVPIGIGQLLLRGAKLKNTAWVHGAVVYTGHDARLLMNSKTAPMKRSSIDTLLNNRMVFLFFTLIALSAMSAVGAELYNKYFLFGAWYMSPTQSTGIAFNVLTFFILYNNLVPISLQVTLEVVRIFQASYINSDLHMYDEELDTPANARTSNLNEELGQVKFLMTDKTGTLTCNVMKFKRCSIAGISYGEDESDQFNDEHLLKTLRRGGPVADDIREFLMMMSTCHTVVAEKKSDGELVYQFSSPDEGALVRGASRQGFVFRVRRPHKIVVKTIDGEVVLQLLNIIEFTSERKRMSIIVRDVDGIIKLYCKGADNVVMERLSAESRQSKNISTFQKHLYEYSCLGYRTLCFASTQIDPIFYDEWAARYHAASVTIEGREKKLAVIAEEIEKDLRLIGVSAIEDKLQDFVPCTIRSLMAADIRIWILTGDKRETAINIAQSSALCTKKTTLMTLDKRCYEEVLADLSEFLKKARYFTQRSEEFGLVISGAALHQATRGDARTLFTELSLLCHAVVCCRLTPMQKAEIVEIVRESTGKVVLAIGDGANDVAMIQSANVGVGIIGEEGLQAASASDYSIAQFHFLRRLLLVHGTWNYDRSVKVIMYSFYKNICLYIIELWFAFFSAFSGQTIFDQWIIASFNIAFTALPPIILGLFDRPISSKLILSHPWLYPMFQNLAFSNIRFAIWIGMSLWHSLLLFFFNYGYLKHQIMWEAGLSGGLMMFGNSCYTTVVVTVVMKALLECNSWTYVMWLSCLGSVCFWFFFLVVYSQVWPTLSIGNGMVGTAWMMFTSISFWMALIFIPITTLLTDFFIKSFVTNIWSTPCDELFAEDSRPMYVKKSDDNTATQLTSAGPTPTTTTTTAAVATPETSRGFTTTATRDITTHSAGTQQSTPNIKTTTMSDEPKTAREALSRGSV